MSTKTKGSLMLLITSLIWGSGFIAQKIGMVYIGPFAFNSIRQLLAACVLLPYAIHLVRREGLLSKKNNSSERLTRRRRELLLAALVCGLLLYAGTNTQQVALVTESAGKAGFITTLYIVFTPLIGLLFGERVKKGMWICIAITMVGFAFLSLKSGLDGISIGDLLLLACALFFAGQIIAVNAFVTRNNAILIAVGELIVSGILGLITSIFVEHPTTAELSAGLLPILYSGLIPTAIGFTMQIVGQKYTDPTITALILSLESVFAAIMGAIILHEQMTIREVIGCLLIFISVILAEMPEKSPSEPGPH